MGIWKNLGMGGYRGFSRPAARLLQQAVQLAGDLGCEQADTGHLLLAMLQQQGAAAQFLTRKNITEPEVRRQLAQRRSGPAQRLDRRAMAPDLRRTMDYALIGAQNAHVSRAEPEHLLCAVHGSLHCRTRRKRKIRTLLQSEIGSDFSCLVGAGGFEPPKLKAADLQSVPIGHSGTRPYSFVAHPYAGRLVYFSMRRGICQLSFLLFFSKFKQHPTKAGKDAMTGAFYGNRALLWCNCRKEKSKII